MTTHATNPTARPPRHRLDGQHWRAVYEPGPVRQFLGAVVDVLAMTARGTARVVGWVWQCLSLLWALR